MSVLSNMKICAGSSLHKAQLDKRDWDQSSDKLTRPGWKSWSARSCFVFSAGPASQRYVRHQSHRTRSQLKKLSIGEVGGSREATGFMEVGYESGKPVHYGSTSLESYLGLLGFILVPIVSKIMLRVSAGPASQRDVWHQSHLITQQRLGFSLASGHR